MYLYRRKEVQPSEERAPQDNQSDNPTDTKEANPTADKEQIGYWRKANHIHGWFVVHVQKGADDCRAYDVTRSDLEALLATVQKVRASINLVPGKVSMGQTLVGGKWTDDLEDGLVIEDHKLAISHLPRYEGYFFGSMEYDQSYVDDLGDTEAILETALEFPDDTQFIYQSWW